MISDTLPGTVPGQQLEDSGEGLHPVPGESLQYGLDLTHLKAIINNRELMTSRIGRKVRTGIPRQVAGHRIPTDCEEKSDPDSLGSPRETSQSVELPLTGFCPHNYVWFHRKLGGM